MPEDALGGIAERISIRGRHAVALEAEKGAGDVEEPRVLDRVVEAIDVAEDRPHALGHRILSGAAQPHPHLVEASRRERLPVQIDPRPAEQP